MVALLIEHPLLLLFIVSALGYTLGRIKIQGSSLGVAAVLFVGLAAGALDPRLSLPEVIFLLGLVIFIYTIWAVGAVPGSGQVHIGRVEGWLTRSEKSATLSLAFGSCIPFANFVLEFPSSYRDAALPLGRSVQWPTGTCVPVAAFAPEPFIDLWSPRLLSPCARDSFAFVLLVFSSAYSRLRILVCEPVHATTKVTTI